MKYKVHLIERSRQTNPFVMVSILHSELFIFLPNKHCSCHIFSWYGDTFTFKSNMIKEIWTSDKLEISPNINICSFSYQNLCFLSSNHLKPQPPILSINFFLPLTPYFIFSSAPFLSPLLAKNLSSSSSKREGEFRCDYAELNAYNHELYKSFTFWFFDLQSVGPI